MHLHVEPAEAARAQKKRKGKLIPSFVLSLTEFMFVAKKDEYVMDIAGRFAGQLF